MDRGGWAGNTIQQNRDAFTLRSTAVGADRGISRIDTEAGDTRASGGKESAGRRYRVGRRQGVALVWYFTGCGRGQRAGCRLNHRDHHQTALAPHPPPPHPQQYDVNKHLEGDAVQNIPSPMEAAAGIDTVIFDKTGTLTSEHRP
jgi:hypothetical protein